MVADMTIKEKYSEQISANFWLWEFVTSSDHPELLDDIELTDGEIDRIIFASRHILQPLRNHLYLTGHNPALRITSGKRSPELNVAVGGSRNSDHLADHKHGIKRAFAFDVKPYDAILFPEMIAWLMPRSLMFKQLGIYKSGMFFHISLPDDSLQYRGIFYRD